jgi:hypothetical protein
VRRPFLSGLILVWLRDSVKLKRRRRQGRPFFHENQLTQSTPTCVLDELNKAYTQRLSYLVPWALSTLIGMRIP